MGVKRGEVLLGRRITITEAESLLREKKGVRIEKVPHYPNEMPARVVLQEYFEPRSKYYFPVYTSYLVIGLKKKPVALILCADTLQAAKEAEIRGAA